MSTLDHVVGRMGWAPAARNRPSVYLLACALGCAGCVLTLVFAKVASPIVALCAMAGLVVAVAMLASPPFAILAVCFSLPFERIGRLTNDVDKVAVSVNRILGVVALISLLIHFALKKKKLHFGTAFYLYAGYTIVALIGNAWAYSPEETFRQCFAILGNLLFFFVVVNLLRTYKDAKRAVLVWLIATMAAGAYSLGDYYYGGSRNSVADAEMGLTSERFTTVVNDGSEVRSLGTNVRRLFGTTAHPTLCGLNNLMAVPFFLWAMRGSSLAQRLFWFAGLLGSVFCMVLSNTRAVFLLAVFTIVFCLARRLWRPTLQTIISLAVLGVVIVPFIPEDVYLRAFDPSLYTTARGDSLRVRFKFWEKSWDLVQETWTHGIGVGNQTTLIERLTDENTGYLSTDGLRASAHNEYIWVMVEVGIVGYLLFWGFVARATTASFAAGSRFRKLLDGGDAYRFMVACQVVLVGVLLFAVQSEAFHYPLKAWWLAAGISCNLLQVARRIPNPAVATGQPTNSSRDRQE